MSSHDTTGSDKNAADKTVYDAGASPFSGHVWKSPLSWRIALTAFAAILIVQLLALGITLSHFESSKVSTLRDSARGYILSSIDHGKTSSRGGGDGAPSRVLAAEALVRGITLYDDKLSVVRQSGDAPSAPLSSTTAGQQPALRKLDIDGKSAYELYFSPHDLGRDYHAIMRVETDVVSPAIMDHVYGMTVALLVLAVAATGLIMVALGRWVLEPILLLSANLTHAVRHAEKPDIRRLKKEPKDEVGAALRVANDLIRQNASNLKRLRAQAEDKIHRLAYYDTLTGLPNRTLFVEKLDDAIRKRVMEEDRRIAVFSVDIDHFKDINDTMGHEFGDKLLEAVSRRLVKVLPPDSVIARSSGDEFMAMVALGHTGPDSEQIAEVIVEVMEEPLSILQEQFQVRVSIGVAHSPDDGMDARQLLKNADIALNRAKAEGRDTVRFYSEALDIAVQHRFQLLRDLRTALDNNEFDLHYQPQIDLKTGALVGAEALLRWYKKNPDGTTTYVPPGDFIAVAEQSSLIVPIGAWVLKRACEMNRQWQQAGLPAFRVSVNLSGVQFHRENIVELVRDTLSSTRLEPQWLELEVTESIFMENIKTAIDTLKNLHDLGVEIAIDDFGTGYSSLSYLRQFPIDRLKIDQSFIRNALNNTDDRTIARTIITLGHSLGLKVIAEGVETPEHKDFLIAEGCDEAQGYLFCRPIPAADFETFVKNHLAQLGKPKLTAVE